MTNMIARFSIALLLALVAACSDSPNPTGPSSTLAPGGAINPLTGSPRISTARESDRAPLGSVGIQCASDTPIVTQANGHGGLIDYVARYGRGTSKAEGEVWKRSTTGPVVYTRYSQFEIGDGVMPFPSYTTEVLPEDGIYKYRTRRLKCGLAVAVGEWSKFADFSVGSAGVTFVPPPFVPPVEEPEGDEPDPIAGGCNAGGGNGAEGCNPGNSGGGHDEVVGGGRGNH